MNKELEKMKYGGYSDLLISKQNEIETLEQELQRKDNIINEMKKASDEIFHKYPYERKKWFDKIKELENEKK